jgi:hypothetical protein
MNATETLGSAVRHGYRNLVGTIVVSLLVSLSLAPLVGTIRVGTSLAVLGGLWTSCLLLGVTLVAGFRFATTVAERGVPIAVLPHLRAAVAAPVTGLGIGIITFLVTVASLALALLTPSAFRAVATGVAAFLLVDWFLLLAFAVPELGSDQTLRVALRAGLERLLVAPGAVALFFAVSLLCALVAGVTVVTIGLFLPGALCLLAAHVTAAVDSDRATDGAASQAS